MGELLVSGRVTSIQSRKIPGAKIARNALLDLSQVFKRGNSGVFGVARNGGNSCKLCSNVGLVNR